MAYLMVVQGSGRRKGFTATLMQEAVDSLKNYKDLEVGVFHLHDYRYGFCTSCFQCIRNVGSGCILDDDWGKKGEGILYRAFKRANGLLMVDPVHGWGITAAAHGFMERIYPTFFEGTPYGMPFASISCASNQGFQYEATVKFCRFAAGYGFRYIGGLPVHLAYFDEARENTRKLAQKLADAALEDEHNGRKKLTDEELFSLYLGTPFELLDGYIQNITDNTFMYETAVPVTALNEGTFKNPEALELLKKTSEHLKTGLELYHAQKRKEAARELALVAKFWTNSTYKEFGEHVVKVTIPKAYRPLNEG